MNQLICMCIYEYYIYTYIPIWKGLKWRNPKTVMYKKWYKLKHVKKWNGRIVYYFDFNTYIKLLRKNDHGIYGNGTT